MQTQILGHHILQIFKICAIMDDIQFLITFPFPLILNLVSFFICYVSYRKHYVALLGLKTIESLD